MTNNQLSISILIEPMLWGLGVAIIILVGVCFYLLWQISLVAIGYKAKILCSGVFVSKRDSTSVENEDLLADNLALLKYVSSQINYQEQSVTASLFGFIKRKAIFRSHLGCTLLSDRSQEEFHRQDNPFEKQKTCSEPQQLDFPQTIVWANELPYNFNTAKLNATLEAAFSEPNPSRLRRTRAVVIVYNGRIVAERYAQGFSSETPLLGWSMTKSVINALIGILVDAGKLSLCTRDLLPEWRQLNDPRQEITLDQLLRMSSGLKFKENYKSLLEDSPVMLFKKGNTAAFAANKQIKTTPGSQWYYSSGTTNILARIIRNTVGETDYFTFPHRALFNPIGMHSAILEPDASGTFVGSSFMYATARDWAKFGLLYLQDGEWNGNRILPQGWVNYSITPTPSDPEQRYGAHFWLKIPSVFTNKQADSVICDRDMYMAVGYQGQFVTIIPSCKLVVVRLGLSQLPRSWDHLWFLEEVVESFSSC